ncbi:MAG TPA: interleukin-like EMT inducer domain-containing protein, partial [bacterium]
DFKAESAGFNDGNFALLWRNAEHVSLNQRGHNLAVFDESDGTLLERASFDTYGSPTNAEALAQFINTVPDGRIVLAAIRDEGSVSMTESAHLALESIGSQLTRQVRLRDAWAIIGRKGVAIGTVPEVLKQAGEGAVAITDTLSRFAKSGRIVAAPIGPALEWKLARLSFESSPQDPIRFSVIGRQRVTGEQDTLLSNLAATEVDLSQISAQTYPQLLLAAALTSTDGLTTPQLQSWSVDFSPPPDLVTGNSEIHVQQDTVEVGTEVQVVIGAANLGLSPADSFFVNIFTGTSELLKLKVGGMPVDGPREYSALFSTSGLSGKIDLTVRLDSNDDVIELDETNNDANFSIWVVRDTLAPNIRVQMDGRAVAVGDFVSANPQVVVEIRDGGPATFTDTSQVLVYLDQQKVSYGGGAGQAQFVPQSNPEQRDLKALSIFRAQLGDGDHRIEVFARDQSGNLNFFEQEFQVSSSFRVTEVLNYPNPLQNETAFTYILTQDADEVRLKIYTVAGRLIQEADFLPARVGFNQFEWNARDFDGDTLANGVYLYKLIARRGEEQVEVVEKLVVMR